MKNHQKSSLKLVLASGNHYLAYFYIFFSINLYWMIPISTIPGRTKTQYLKLGIEFKHSVKTGDFIFKTSFL